MLGGGVKVRLAAKNSLRESGPPSKLAGTVDKAKDGPKVISPSLNWMIMLELIGRPKPVPARRANALALVPCLTILSAP